jgi:hypothetical protein
MQAVGDCDLNLHHQVDHKFRSAVVCFKHFMLRYCYYEGGREKVGRGGGSLYKLET